MYFPDLKSMRVAKTYILGDYVCTVGTDCVSNQRVQYAHVLLVTRPPSETPAFAVAAEVNAMAGTGKQVLERMRAEGKSPQEMAATEGLLGSHFLGVFPGEGHRNLGASDRWAELESFTEKALEVVSKEFGVTSAPVERPAGMPEALAAAKLQPKPSGRALRLTDCPKCQETVSAESATCPQCGYSFGSEPSVGPSSPVAAGDQNEGSPPALPLPASSAPPPPAPPRHVCRFCKKEVKKFDKKCPHCGEILDVRERSRIQTAPADKRNLSAASVLELIGSVVMTALFFPFMPAVGVYIIVRGLYLSGRARKLGIAIRWSTRVMIAWGILVLLGGIVMWAWAFTRGGGIPLLYRNYRRY